MLLLLLTIYSILYNQLERKDFFFTVEWRFRPNEARTQLGSRPVNSSQEQHNYNKHAAQEHYNYDRAVCCHYNIYYNDAQKCPVLNYTRIFTTLYPVWHLSLILRVRDTISFMHHTIKFFEVWHCVNHIQEHGSHGIIGTCSLQHFNCLFE